jgi:hypothetical protein
MSLEHSVEQLIPDTTADARMAELERFLETYLGPRRPEFGSPEEDVRSAELPAPLARFFRFAGRWPGQNPRSPYLNRFCMQDHLCSLLPNANVKWLQTLRMMDDRVIFLWENQGVWIAATERTGEDPPVWITEDCSHRSDRRVWRQLEKPLSHFLVSFVLQELLFGSQLTGYERGLLAKFQKAGMSTQPVWINGEYGWNIDGPSYFLADGRFIIRQAPAEGDGHEFYGCDDAAGPDVITSLGLLIELR